MSTVYILQHRYEIEDDAEEVKTIGVFSSEAKAREAIELVVKQPGFRDHPDDFCVDGYPLDEIEWAEGFITQDEWRASIESISK